jgi:hypothetical protein
VDTISRARVVVKDCYFLSLQPPPLNPFSERESGWAGLECGVAALFLIHSLPWPVIPLMSITAPGVGVVIEDVVKKRERGL